MQLLSSPASPYARKVRVTARLKGLAGQIEEVPNDATNAAAQSIAAKNPVAKIPVLITGDGNAIHDSHVICEYLDAQVSSPVLFPGEGPARWDALTNASIGDGIIDAAILLVYEKRFRPENLWHQEWMDRQQAKIDGAVAHFEANLPEWQGTPNYGHLTVACALGYLDFRHQGKWRPSAPKLVDWLERYAKAVPAFGETAPPAA
ncbi:MAG TPA: glutathione S-transferase [Hyphomicrobiaceae bacterium]|nr:glutathione S-transferase [Hyphomicrobiaceae bacterium]